MKCTLFSQIVISYHCYLFFLIFVLVIFCYVTNELKTINIYYLAFCESRIHLRAWKMA